MTDVELIKSKIDIVEFLSEYMTLKKAGRNYKGLCPFHGEKTPSFIVSPERQTWHCFGACAEGGDAIRFLEKWENLEFLEALQILAKRTGVVLSQFTPTEGTKLKDKLFEINHLASEFFHYLLTSHRLGESASRYLKEREIRKETIRTFLLGYSPNSWDSLLQFLLKKNYAVEDIFTAGLLVKSREGRYYDRFRGRLMFTLRDHRGNIVGFSGRILPAGRTGREEAKYINTSDTPVYIKGDNLYGLDVTKEAIKREKEAVAVEGEFDLLASYQSGVSNVVAIKGSALTQGQCLLLKRYTQNLKLSLDNDFAGSEASRRGIEVAENAGFTVRVIKLPFGKDPADCVQKDPHLFKDAVREAVPVYDFIMENALNKYKDEGAAGKKKVGNEVVPFLMKISNPIVSSHYVKLLAKKLDVTEESIEILMRQFQKKEKVAGPTIDQVPPRPRNILLEEYLLSLILQSANVEDSLKETTGIISFDDLGQPPVKAILLKLQAFINTHKKFDAGKFGAILSPEVLPSFDRAYLVDIEKIISDEGSHRNELINSCLEIKKISLRRTIGDLSTKIRLEEERAEGERNNAGVINLQEKQRDLLSQLDKIDKSSRKR